MHFGELDAHIPLSDVDKIKAALSGVPVHIYAADHGFNCNHRGSYNEEAAKLAYERTLAHFAEHLV
jgi:carboxymethylenebutenolidase